MTSESKSTAFRPASFNPNRRLPSAALLLTAMAGTPALARDAAPPGSTAAAPTAYAIPAGSLAGALNRFADASGLQIIYDTILTRGLKSPGLSGTYPPREALRQLLDGSGLGFRAGGEGTYTLERIAQTEPVPKEGVVLQKVKVEATEGRYESTDPYNPDYNRPNATTATKTDTPIMETPMSIQVVPKGLIEDQQAIQLKDALKNVSGVFTGNQSGEYGYDKFFIRGFANAGSTQIYRNGLLLPRSNNDTFNIEQIEILKGPAAILYGRVEPGGIINTVTKKPLEISYYLLQQRIGSFDHYRTMADATGPLLADKSLLYRVNIAYQDTGTFVDLVDNERILVAPSLQWKPSSSDVLNFRLEYQKDDSRYYDGFPAIGQRPADIPISTFLGWGGNNEYQKQQRIVAGYDWTHAFNDDWKVTNRFAYTKLDYTFINTYYGTGLARDGRTFTRKNYHYPLDQTDTYATNLDLTGRFDTFGVSHRVLLGFDYYRIDKYAEGYYGTAPAGFIPSVDIHDPLHADVPLLSRSDYNDFRRSSQYWYGLYFQDQMTFFEKLHLLLGGRHDWATDTKASASTAGAYATARDKIFSDTAFTPRLGILYQVQPSLSIYANYVESFGLNNGLGFNNQPLKPQTATQYEGGIKKEWLDGRLITTLAYYDLTKENLTTTDPLHPQFVIPVGKARSRGVEFDISGHLTENLNLIGSYSYTDTEILKDNLGNQGNRFSNVPERAGSLWGKYDFTQGAFNGLHFASGLYFISQREGNNANSFQLPGYIRWDAAAGYKWAIGKTEVSIQLNVNNLLDKRYYDASPAGATDIYPGIPRTFLGSIKITL